MVLLFFICFYPIHWKYYRSFFSLPVQKMKRSVFCWFQTHFTSKVAIWALKTQKVTECICVCMSVNVYNVHKYYLIIYYVLSLLLINAVTWKAFSNVFTLYYMIFTEPMCQIKTTFYFPMRLLYHQRQKHLPFIHVYIMCERVCICVLICYMCFCW